MTVHLNPAGGQFTQKDFDPLEEHYGEQTVQAHVMAAYAERGLVAMDGAVRLSEDYFVLERDAFLRRWMPGKGMEIRRQTTGASFTLLSQSGSRVALHILMIWNFPDKSRGSQSAQRRPSK